MWQVLQHCELRGWTPCFQAEISLSGWRSHWKEALVLRHLLSRVKPKEQLQHNHKSPGIRGKGLTSNSKVYRLVSLRDRRAKVDGCIGNCTYLQTYPMEGQGSCYREPYRSCGRALAWVSLKGTPPYRPNWRIEEISIKGISPNHRSWGETANSMLGEASAETIRELQEGDS